MNLLKTMLLWLFIVITKIGYTQLVYNNGSSIVIKNKAVLRVKDNSFENSNEGYIYNQGILIIDENIINTNGSILNEDSIDVNGSLINYDSLICSPNSSSYINIAKNWINNSIFISGASSVNLDGNDQLITGVENSRFYNLITLGFVGETKRLVGVNIEVSNVLNLTSAEVATGSNTIRILNTDTAAIKRKSGFVSSIDSGRLERYTNSINSYLFPVGSSLNIKRYRPVVITPISNKISKFGVRLANTNATNEGFDTNFLNDSLCNVNSNFYHKLNYTDSAKIDIKYIESEDGFWNVIAYNDNFKWVDIPNSQGNIDGFSSIVFSNEIYFNQTNFVLGFKNPCTISDNNPVVVSPLNLFLPTAFTPNNDGINDVFKPLNSNLDKYNIIVRNRWGEIVYQTSDVKVGWDGLYKGSKAPMGVYIYIVEYSFVTEMKTHFETGNLTLIR